MVAKRFLTVFVAALLMIALAGCGGGGRAKKETTELYTYELSIPWELIGGKPDSGEIGITSELYNTDDASKKDIVGDTKADNPSTWFTLALAEAAGASPKSSARSAIEWNRYTYRVFASVYVDGRTITELHYPRVKKLQNGDLLMFFQHYQHSWDILYMRSTDGGKTWEQPKYFIRRQSGLVNEFGENDTRCFATADAIQLRNGDILVAYSFRYDQEYGRLNKHSGIGVRISKDNGRTWSDEIIAYRGANWEPSLLQLPSGEVQLYYTQQGPYHEEPKDPRFSVEVGLVRSFDNGLTWVPEVTGPPWRGIRLSQNEGHDGMAVAVVLKDNKGIAYACESWHASQPGPWIVWSSMEKNWDYPEFQPHLVNDEPNYGPWDRRWKVHDDFVGYAPYLVRMETGETVVSSNGTFKGVGSFYVFVGDDEAKNFADPSQPFPMRPGGFWGCLEVKDSNTLIASIQENQDLLYTEGHFIRDFNIPRSNITVDGQLNENVWKEKYFLFMGSDARANGYVRAAHNNDKLHLALELNKEKKWENWNGVIASIYIDAGNSKVNGIRSGIYRIDISNNGVKLMKADDSGQWSEVDSSSVEFGSFRLATK